MIKRTWNEIKNDVGLSILVLVVAVIAAVAEPWSDFTKIPLTSIALIIFIGCIALIAKKKYEFCRLMCWLPLPYYLWLGMCKFMYNVGYSVKWYYFWGGMVIVLFLQLSGYLIERNYWKTQKKNIKTVKTVTTVFIGTGGMGIWISRMLRGTMSDDTELIVAFILGVVLVLIFAFIGGMIIFPYMRGDKMRYDGDKVIIERAIDVEDE